MTPNIELIVFSVLFVPGSYGKQIIFQFAIRSFPSVLFDVFGFQQHNLIDLILLVLGSLFVRCLIEQEFLL
jgi:hypothetical protein